MSDTKIQVKVTLTALTAGIFPLIRILYLHENHQTIPIGRSSKNPQKHLFAAADNCWVDSDVVSRDHASLKFDSDLERVFIEDTKSMHGTRINNKQIPKNDPIPLANNDVISLGAEVKRGIETYPECRFRVNYELLPYFPSTGRTYQLLSDDEDEPYEISDDEPFEVSDDDEEVQRKDSPSTSTPELKGSTMSEGLDATADDDVVEIDPSVYEFSRLPTKTAKLFQADVESVNESMEPSDSDGDSIASSDPEPSERPIGRGSSVDIAVERAPLQTNIDADDNNHEISSDSGIEFSEDDTWPDSDNSDEDTGGVLDDEFLAACVAPNFDLDTSLTNEHTVNPPDSPLREPAAEDRPQWLNPKPSIHLPQIEHFVAPITQAPLAPMFSSRASLESATLKPLDLETDLLSTQETPLSMPSPSDAALKGPRATTPPWRTEKQEFLAARVDNRAKFAAHWMDVEPLENTVVAGESSFAGGSGGLSSSPNAYNQQKKPDSNCNSISQEDIVSLREKPSVQAMLLDMPSEPPLKRKRDQITDDEPLGVTKAPETFQTFARNVKAISDARAMRRAQVVTAVSAHNTASTAADMPMTMAVSVAAYSGANVDKTTPAPAPTAKSTTALAPSGATATTVEPTPQDQERPAKRQKQEETKAARRFAYATFGGFVAGASLFVALVATAPDFAAFV
ncbi:hypothetical protein V496_02890 [Pseudogymnoascus sp. VKM F-4515 (FW-2607)]|nr:hypothetical protein V496_02890 [Pseudogymnoascus sp. VKM F-4515 (FW-2607)]